MTTLAKGGTAAAHDPGRGRDIIPLNDLRRQTARLKADFDRVIGEVVTGGWYVLGPNVKAFETEFAQYCGVGHAIGVANGTDALELALRALTCGPGSEVATVANAGMYAAAAVMATGAKPVLVDIDETMTMSPQSLSSAIGPATRAVVVTHLYGQLADMDRLMQIAARHGVPVVEDCAQSHGAERAGRKAGSFGAVGCFSFYPTKNLGALGDGGALTTSDDALADTIRSLRQYGWHKKYEANRPFGRNSRLDEIQAAVLRVKLAHLDEWNERRRAIMRQYHDAAKGALRVPRPIGKDHVAHLCVARTPHRESLRSVLEAHGIASDCHYPVPDHHQQALRGIVPADLVLAHTEAAAREILTVPCFPEMTEDEVTRVCAALKTFCESGG